ncbi:unnamed protein product [Lota lota]
MQASDVPPAVSISAESLEQHIVHNDTSEEVTLKWECWNIHRSTSGYGPVPRQRDSSSPSLRRTAGNAASCHALSRGEGSDGQVTSSPEQPQLCSRGGVPSPTQRPSTDGR